MGYFDRFSANKGTSSNPAEPSGTATPPPGSVRAQLISAREKLEAKDLPGALAIYEELLRASGDRADVLVALSGDLGSCGHVEQIIELVAPHYDAERHGPATGLNLLQAYLVTRNTGAAQHLLDILFALDRPELQQRLHGFSNALAEQLEAERLGQLPPPSTEGGSDEPLPLKTINLASISRPIWSYGLEGVANLLPPKEGKKRRVAFAQLALIDLPDWLQKMSQPEDDLARLSRGLPLWLSETLYFCPHYAPVAAIAMAGKEHYGIFSTEWTPDNIRQLVSTSTEGLDYVFTGALKCHGGEYDLVLRLWEIKKLRERKVFNVHFTSATADAELSGLQEQVRTFMEFSPYPAGNGLTYTPPPNPFAWCETLGASLTFFLAEKAVLPKEQLAATEETLARIAGRAATSETASLAWLALQDRAPKLDLAGAVPPNVPLAETPLVLEAKRALGL